MVLGVDNEQKSGKTFTSSIGSTLITSTICVVVGFFFKFNTYIQFIIGGNTCFWRYPEKQIGDSKEKALVLQKALFGREEGQ